MKIYAEAQPENAKSTYQEFDTIDIILTADPNMDYKANSFTLHAKLHVEQPAGTVPLANDSVDVFFNSKIGIHGVIDSIQTEHAGGQIENLQEYGRLCSMVECGTKDRNDRYNSQDVAELKSPDDIFSKRYCQGNTTDNSGAKILDDYSFSVKPKFCLNKQIGNLSMAKAGFVKVSINLARNLTFLYTKSIAAATQQMTYSLSDVKVSYELEPTVNGSATMQTSMNIKQSINSSFANISAKVPVPASAVTISFLDQLKENAANHDNYALEDVHPKSVQYLFNNALNKYITYKVETKSDMLQRGIESLADTGHNAVSCHNYKANDAFLVGLNFQELVDLSNSSFNFQINSDYISGTSPFLVFLYFHSIATL